MPVKFKQCVSGVCKVLITPGGKVGMGDDCCCCECTVLTDWVNCYCTPSNYGPHQSRPQLQYDIPAADAITSAFQSWVDNSACFAATSFSCPSIAGSYVLNCNTSLCKRVHTVLCDEILSSPARKYVIVTDLTIVWGDRVRIESRVERVRTTELGNIDYFGSPCVSGMPAMPTGTLGSSPLWRRTWTHGCYDAQSIPNIVTDGDCDTYGYYQTFTNWRYELGGTCKTECNTAIVVPGCDMKTTQTDEIIAVGAVEACKYSGTITVTQL